MFGSEYLLCALMFEQYIPALSTMSSPTLLSINVHEGLPHPSW